MRTLFFAALLVPILLASKDAQAGWAENARTLETITKGRHKTFNRMLKRRVKKMCDDGVIECGGGETYESLTNRMLGDAGFMARLAAKLKPQLGTATTPTDLNAKIRQRIEEESKFGGVLRTYLVNWIDQRIDDKINVAMATLRAELKPKTATISRSLQMILGLNAQYLRREQGYLPAVIGLRADMGGGNAFELALLFGVGRDWEREDDVDFVFGGRGIAAIELVENFNFRFGIAGIMKLAAQDGATRSGDLALSLGVELEFARWISFVVDVGPTWSLREDASGVGFMANAGPVLRVF